MSGDLFSPPGIVRPAEDMAALFATANAEHEAGLKAERASLEHYRRAGEALARAKAAAGHGKWLKVLGARSKILHQRASEYMRLAKGWDKLPPGGNFTLKGALSFLGTEEPEGQEPAPASPAPGPGEPPKPAPPAGVPPGPASKPSPPRPKPKPKPASGATPTPPRPTPRPAPPRGFSIPEEHSDWLIEQINSLGCDSVDGIVHDLKERLAEPPDELADPDEPGAWDWEALEGAHDELETLIDQAEDYIEGLKDIMWLLDNTDPQSNTPEHIKQFLAKFRSKG
jgi:hypothetical protein